MISAGSIPRISVKITIFSAGSTRFPVRLQAGKVPASSRD
jgi:hypothetical protein